jgi:hypothetical protein
MTEQHEIRCDSEGCASVIIVPNKIDEEQAAQVARVIGWSASLGAARFYHHCLRCRAVKR